MRALLRRASGRSSEGRVKTTWKQGTGSRRSMRSAIHRARSVAWHFGQCRSRQELYELCSYAQVSHTSR